MPHPSARPVARLLPWTGSADQPCYLLTDQTGDGPVSRYADRVEALQLEMSIGLLDHAEPLIDDPSADAGQLRFLSAQLRTALRDTVRVAESRGERLAAYQRSQEPDEPDESDETDEPDESDTSDESAGAAGGAFDAQQLQGDASEGDQSAVDAPDAERPGSDEPEGPEPEEPAPEGDEPAGDRCADKGAESGESEEPNKSATARTNKAGRSG